MSEKRREDIPSQHVPEKRWLSHNEPRHVYREEITRRQDLDKEGVLKRIGKRIGKFEEWARRVWVKGNL